MKNKKILNILICCVVITCSIGVLYFTTDLFKTNKEIFFEKISEIDILDKTNIEKIISISDKINQNSKTSETNFEILKLNNNQQVNNTGTEKILSISSKMLDNRITNQSYKDFSFFNNDVNLLTLKYVKDNNIYAIGADNILTKYLAVENANLKELFLKLGVEDTTAIPDSIVSDPNREFNIDKEKVEILAEKYLDIIFNNIDKENFSKIKNKDKTNILELVLSEQQAIDLVKKILETMKNDEMFLTLIVDSAHGLEYGDINKEKVQSKIQEFLDKAQQKECSNEKDFIKISLIRKNKNITKLIYEVDYNKTNYEKNDSNEQAVKKNRISVEVDLSEMDKKNIIIKENEVELINIMFFSKCDDNNITLECEILFKNTEENENFIKINYQMDDYQTDNIKQNYIIDISMQSAEKIEIKINKNVVLKQEVQITKLTDENSAKLNDMSAEEIKQLLIALKNRTDSLYGTGNIGSVLFNGILQNML